MVKMLPPMKVLPLESVTPPPPRVVDGDRGSEVPWPFWAKPLVPHDGSAVLQQPVYPKTAFTETATARKTSARMEQFAWWLDLTRIIISVSVLHCTMDDSANTVGSPRSIQWRIHKCRGSKLQNPLEEPISSEFNCFLQKLCPARRECATIRFVSTLEPA